MSGTIPATEPGSVVISPEHVRELRVLLFEVRKQQYAPETCGHVNSAAVAATAEASATGAGSTEAPAARMTPRRALGSDRCRARAVG